MFLLSDSCLMIISNNIVNKKQVFGKCYSFDRINLISRLSKNILSIYLIMSTGKQNALTKSNQG